MSTSLLDKDDDNELTLVLERSGLVNDNLKGSRSSNGVEAAIQEIESSIKENTTDLSLGKAMHLLLNIHTHVFDKAVMTLSKMTSPADLLLNVAESPTIRAIVSVDNYLKATGNENNTTGELFKHIYYPLKEKFLKRHPNEPAIRIVGYLLLRSQHKIDIQNFLLNELKHEDKKGQLAVIVLLRSLFAAFKENVDLFDLSCRFVPALVDVAERYSISATVLPCSACELALSLSLYIIIHYHDSNDQENLPNTLSETKKMVEIIEDNNKTEKDKKTKEAIKVCVCTSKLVDVMFMWFDSKTQFETASQKEIRKFINCAGPLLSDNVLYRNITDAFTLLLTSLNPKSIMSKKPLTTKKQQEILLFGGNEANQSPFSSCIRLCLLAALQKGQWIERFGSDRSSTTTIILSAEEQDIKSLIANDYKTIVQSFPIEHFDKLGSDIIPQLILCTPHLCPVNVIYSKPLVQTIVEDADYSRDMLWLTPFILKQPESSILSLLLHAIEKDNQLEPSFSLLVHLINQGSEKVVLLLESNLLSVVKRSNLACELLIQCMPYAHLPTLIQKMMPLIVTGENERERLIHAALISKALLQTTWTGDSVLYYIELIRDVKFQKGFRLPTTTYDTNDLKLQTPSSIIAYKAKNRNSLLKEYNEQELKEVCTNLMGPLQLWSSKASTNDLAESLKQFVRKSYSMPSDEIYIDAWRHLRVAFQDNHPLVWPVMQEVVDILTTQVTFASSLVKDMSEKARQLKMAILLFRLNPMLILQTIPQEAFDLVKLPKSYVDLLSNKLKLAGLEPDRMKLGVVEKYSSTCTRLADALLMRVIDENVIDGELASPVEFIKSLIEKIFMQ